MIKEELKKKAEEYVNAIIDTFKQDVKGTLYGKLNQEDVKDFLISFYIDCAEPREKRIEDLEETINKLREQFALRYDLEDMLKKENAELKEKYADLEKKYFNNITDCEWCDTYCNLQLIKATEIIKEFARLEYADYTNGDYSNELSKVLEQAEQFLKEIEK